MGRNLTDGERAIVVAHFLRLVNPMNYFLTPQTHGRRVNNHRRRIQTLVVGGAEFVRGIQELPEMKRFMRMKRIQEYGDAFVEYERLAMSLQRDDVVDDSIDLAIDLHFCPPNEELDGVGVQVDDVHVRRGQRRRNANGGRVLDVAFDPIDPEEFKRMLIQRRRAKRIFVYADGRRVVEIWRAERFTRRSNLMNNIRSSVAYQKAVRDGAVRVEFNFDGIN